MRGTLSVYAKVHMPDNFDIDEQSMGTNHKKFVKNTNSVVETKFSRKKQNKKTNDELTFRTAGL